MDPSSCQYHHTTHLCVPIWEVSWKLWWLLCLRWSCFTLLVETLNQHGKISTFISKIQMVYLRLHMLWMGIWIHHHDVTTTHVCPAELGSRLNLYYLEWTKGCSVHCLWLQTHMEWFPHWCQIYEMCLTKLHMLWMGIWIGQHDILQPHLLVKVEKVNLLLNNWYETKGGIVHWLGLQTNMEWVPYPVHINKRCLTTFICCGWGYRVLIMPLLPHFTLVCLILGSQLKTLVTAWCWMKLFYIAGWGWDCKPTWNDFYIHFKNANGIFEASSAVNGGMDPHLLTQQIWEVS